MTEPVHDMLAAAGLLPDEHAVDAGYTSADLLLAARARGITLLGPLLAKLAAGPHRGIHRRGVHHRLGPPAGHLPPGRHQHQVEPVRPAGEQKAIVVRFAAASCQACPAKDQCTSSSRTGRQLSLRPREIHEAVAAARAGQATSPRFAAVMCEDIERSGRDTFNALKLERQLATPGSRCSPPTSRSTSKA